MLIKGQNLYRCNIHFNIKRVYLNWPISPYRRLDGYMDLPVPALNKRINIWMNLKTCEFCCEPMGYGADCNFFKVNELRVSAYIRNRNIYGIKSWQCMISCSKL